MFVEQVSSDAEISPAGLLKRTDSYHQPGAFNGLCAPLRASVVKQQI